MKNLRLSPEAQYEQQYRLRQQRKQQSRWQNAYEKGIEHTEIQHEMPLDFQTRGNNGLPRSPSHFKQFTGQEKYSLPPNRDAHEASNYFNPGTIRRFHRHLPQTLAAQYRADMRKIAKKKLEQDLANAQAGQEDLIISTIKDFDRKKPQKTPPSATYPHSELPKNYQKHASLRYPSVAFPFNALLYLYHDCDFTLEAIAFALNSSPAQVYIYYEEARYQHLVSSLSCPPIFKFKKPRNKV